MRTASYIPFATVVPFNYSMIPSTVCCSEIYRNLDYEVSDLEAAAGGKIAVSDDKVVVLMARMRNPSLSLHGIEGAFSGVGAKTVIPAHVIGKFSLRYVHARSSVSSLLRLSLAAAN